MYQIKVRNQIKVALSSGSFHSQELINIQRSLLFHIEILFVRVCFCRPEWRRLRWSRSSLLLARFWQPWDSESSMSFEPITFLIFLLNKSKSSVYGFFFFYLFSGFGFLFIFHSISMYLFSFGRKTWKALYRNRNHDPNILPYALDNPSLYKKIHGFPDDNRWDSSQQASRSPPQE